ncbi:MAG TPA: histidine kinase dimerization/phosphoacceptor domain -containing protein [bacterium]|nr:histidine kinase dimerization/phosphoacceptor domain -containing protein [bacterium]
MKILIVDDNKDDRQVLRYMAERYGHTVFEAWNGADALEKAESFFPDLVISDVLMPVMDGFQFLRSMKQDAVLASIPFVFYSSSYKESQDIRLAMSLGADAYILKPLEPEELWSRIEALLKARVQKGPVMPSLAEDDAEYLKQYSNVMATKLEAQVRRLELTLEEQQKAELALSQSEYRLRSLFEDSPISIWEDDFSDVKRRIDEATAAGICDWTVFFGSRERVAEFAALVRVIDVNHATLRLFEYDDKTEIVGSLRRVLDDGLLGAFHDEMIALASGQTHFECETVNIAKSGRRIFVQLRLTIVPGSEANWSRVLVSHVDMTEYRNAERAMQESEAKYRGLVEQSSEGIILLDDGGVLKDCNPFFERLVGEDKRRLLGSGILEPWFKRFLGDELSETEYLRTVETWKSALHDGRPALPVGPFGTAVESAAGNRLIIELTLFPISMGPTLMVGGIIRDITSQRKAADALCASLREKEILLKEVHHRVKNNLQIICSLINLQLLDAGENAVAARLLVDMESRVRSMSIVHETLYESDDFSHIDFSSYVKQLCNHLFSTYNVDPRRINIEIAVMDISLSLDKAIPCGLLLNELVAYELSQGFPGNSTGTVRIGMHRREDGLISLTIRDDGSNNAKPMKDNGTHRAIGLTLVDALVEQLGGSWVRDEDEAVRASVLFPA